MRGLSPQLALLCWGFSQATARSIAFWAKGSPFRSLTFARVGIVLCHTLSLYTVGHSNLPVCRGSPPRLLLGPSLDKRPLSPPRSGCAFSVPRKLAQCHAVSPPVAFWTVGQLHEALYRKWVRKPVFPGIISGSRHFSGTFSQFCRQFRVSTGLFYVAPSIPSISWNRSSLQNGFWSRNFCLPRRHQSLFQSGLLMYCGRSTWLSKELSQR